MFRAIFRVATFALVLSSICETGHAAIPGSERNALIAIYNSSNGDGWNDNANWCAGACPKSGTPTFNSAGTECTWYGITCDAALAHVTKIVLYSNFLSGTIADITGFPSLQQFSVDQNQLSGSLPNWSGLGNLQIITVGQNAFSGSVPSLATAWPVPDVSTSPQSEPVVMIVPALSGMPGCCALA